MYFQLCLTIAQLHLMKISPEKWELEIMSDEIRIPERNNPGFRIGNPWLGVGVRSYNPSIQGTEAGRSLQV